MEIDKESHVEVYNLLYRTHFKRESWSTSSIRLTKENAEFFCYISQKKRSSIERESIGKVSSIDNQTKKDLYPRINCLMTEKSQ